MIVRVLGIDAALRCTGLGVIEHRAGRWVGVGYGVVRNPPKRPHSACLHALQEALDHWLAEWQPGHAAIEGGFFFRNAKTAMVLGEARGVVLARCAAAGVPVYEYAPRVVKQALTGHGGAEKAQLARMLGTLLGMRDKLPADAADALAIALCHAQSHSGIRELRSEPI